MIGESVGLYGFMKRGKFSKVGLHKKGGKFRVSSPCIKGSFDIFGIGKEASYGCLWFSEKDAVTRTASSKGNTDTHGFR
jgi:hypothetical protein